MEIDNRSEHHGIMTCMSGHQRQVCFLLLGMDGSVLYEQREDIGVLWYGGSRW